MHFMQACASMVVRIHRPSLEKEQLAVLGSLGLRDSGSCGQEQVESEAKEDEETYDKFKCWCHECCPRCWERLAEWSRG